MAWYEDWFGRDEYELVYGHRNDEEAGRAVDLIERLAVPAKGDAILDMACGRGRHARCLARRGYEVTGVDLSERAIEAARARARAEGLDVVFLRGDMRDPVCNACFDGVVNLFTAFGYFERERDHLRALRAMAHALKPGGWIVQDFLNAPRVVGRLVPEDRRAAGDVEIVQHRWVDDGRINKRIEIQGDSTVSVFNESVRLFTLNDFRKMYPAVGLDLLEVMGDYDGAAYTPDAPRLILYARRCVDE
ncbi:MAG TPA: methyltransferase domain-containing protein [Rhodothermales bacterium]|nr:methyltransferase domain-containing protein [Rhodothermales bacterium]